jgi:hypothetical protein
MGVKSGIARHGRALVSIIVVQTLLIFWLTSWAVGDYLNNQYVRAYVNLTIQADAWMIGAVVLVSILVPSMGLVLRRRRSATLTIGVAHTQSKIPRPSLATAGSPRPTMAIASAKATAQPALSSNMSASAQSTAFSKPSTELHPAVAALKADLSEARLSLGLASVTTGPERTPGPSTPGAKFEDQKPTFRPPYPPLQHAATTGPGPQLANANPIPAPSFSRPVPPTVIRPMAPATPGTVAPPHQALPTLKVEAGTPATPRPVGLLPRPETAPMATQDISTIITGFMPSQQQKKKESESSNSKSDSQH